MLHFKVKLLPLQKKPFFRYTSDKHFGSRLYQFSADQNVPLKNVFLGGCQGEVAASGVREGFELQASKGSHFKGSKFDFFGTRKGWDVSGLRRARLGHKYLTLGWSKHHNEFSGLVYRRKALTAEEAKTEYFIFPKKGIKEFVQVKPEENTISDILDRGQLSDFSKQFVVRFPSTY